MVSTLRPGSGTAGSTTETLEILPNWIYILSMSDTFSSIGEAASQAANDVLLSQTSSFLTWVKGLLTWEHLFNPAFSIPTAKDWIGHEESIKITAIGTPCLRTGKSWFINRSPV